MLEREGSGVGDSVGVGDASGAGMADEDVGVKVGKIEVIGVGDASGSDEDTGLEISNWSLVI